MTAITVLAVQPLAAQSGLGDLSQNELVEATLIADVSAVTPGRPFRVGVLLRMKPTWHVNWINPGDAGLAPGVSWDLPDGFRAGPLEWPYPGRFDAGSLVVFGYDDAVLLWTDITVPERIDGGQVTIDASVSWLACQEACVPGEAVVSLTLPAGTTASPENRETFDRARSDRPAEPGAWRVSGWYADRETIVLEFQSAESGAPAPVDPFFFPFEQGIIENAGSQRLSTLSTQVGSGGYRLTIPRDQMVGAEPRRLTGVLVSGEAWSAAAGAPRAIEVDIEMLDGAR